MFCRVEGSGIKRTSSGGGWHQEDVEWEGSGTKRMSSGEEWHQEEEHFIEWGGVPPRRGAFRRVEGSGTKRTSSGGE